MGKVKEIEEKCHLDDLHEYLSSKKELRYRGIITANNCPIEQPKVLFIGYNPGPGLFHANGRNAKKSVRTFKDNSLNKLDWIAKGSLRAGDWYDLKSKYQPNNTYIKNLVRFLKIYYSIDELKLEQDEAYRKEKETKINAEIFSWNIYPIATDNGKELRDIIKHLEKQHPLKDWPIMNDKVKVDLSNFFRQRTIDLIYALQPTYVVCLGVTTFKELTRKPLTSKENDDLFTVENVKLRKDSCPNQIYVIKRKGNWEHRMKKLAEAI